MHGEDPRRLSAAELVSLCAMDTRNAHLWAEFLRRFVPRIRAFVRKSLRMFNGSRPICLISEENDLVQNTVLRLVENDCAQMKRFRGSEKDFFACLAVITQSVVMDSLRRQRAVKRRFSQSREETPDFAVGPSWVTRREYAAERRVLANEVWGISLRAIRNLSGSSSVRDRQIFDLHYSQGLSVHEIARVKEVGLSKTGIENVLNRLKDRVRATVRGSKEQEQ